MSIPKFISFFREILGNHLKALSENSFTTGTDSRLGVLKSMSLTLTRWYMQPLEIIFLPLRQETTLPFGIEIPSSHSKIGSFEN